MAQFRRVSGASKQTLLAPTDEAFLSLGRGVAASLLPLGWKGLEGLVQHGDYMVMIWFQHDATLENGETMVDVSAFNGDLGDI